MVKTSPFNAEGMCLIPGQEAKIPYASWPKKSKHKKQKQYCNKFNKEFKNGPHFKISLKNFDFQENNFGQHLGFFFPLEEL